MSAEQLCATHDEVLRWYAAHARDLPWRRPEATPWSVLVSEVMLQQTPVARVEPVWRTWMARWPAAADLAADPPGDAVRAWGGLGYPRRALRLHQTAVAIAGDHGSELPTTPAQLRSLPGVGAYTAAAVAAFAFGYRSAVVDTNVRRVEARLLSGVGQAAPTLTAAERAVADQALPSDPDRARAWNVAVMELGALVCTARAPHCPDCPVAEHCAWLRAGRPAYDGPVRRPQGWAGTDRQARGALLAALRASPVPLRAADLDAAWPQDATQRQRAIDGLLSDGLMQVCVDGSFALPGSMVRGPV